MGKRNRQYTIRDMKRIVLCNGYVYISCKGDHFKYRNGHRTIILNNGINQMVAQRIIKENNLIVD